MPGRAKVNANANAWAALPNREDITPSRRRFALWALLYALILVYASTVLGPEGINFVGTDPIVALRMLLSISYQANGSDQRADWVANLLLLAPLGFLLAGAVLRGGPLRRAIGAGIALCSCLLFVLMVKYAQLFFPPRTVTLNYILAQSLGSTLGIACYWLAHERLGAGIQTMRAGGRNALKVVLAAYAVALLLFYFYPFDFVLSADDFQERTATLPALMLSWPGAGRSIAIRLILVLAGTAATVPIGMLFAILNHGRSLLWLSAVGSLMMAVLTALTILVLSTTPFLAAILYRTAGFSLGTALVIWMARQDLRRWIWLLGRSVPVMIAPYGLAVLLVNGVLTLHWRSPNEALADLDVHSLLPFWEDYIVSKAWAAQSIAAHVAMYAPIGVMLSLWRGAGRTRGGGVAATLGFLISFAVELGRFLRPDGQPDVNNIIIGAVAAVGAVKITPFLCRLLAEGIRDDQATAGGTPALIPPKTTASRRSTKQVRNADRHGAVGTFWRSLISVGCLAVTAAALWRYPLAPWLLTASLVLYAAALWQWPLLWLAVIPAVLPSVDLAPWTGWFYVAESDLFLLTTIGVLVWRVPLQWPDILLDRRTQVIVLGVAAVSVVGVIKGLRLDIGPLGGSDNPYLRPDNALRLAKGVGGALLLLPFLRHALRTGSRVLVWFSAGMMAGLALVSAAVIAERIAFTGLFDFASDYRVVGTFSSMHIGGGHIGAYLAMALPFTAMPLLRSRPLPFAAMLLIGGAGGYALMVTFARTAYAAALAAVFVLGIGWILANLHRTTNRLSATVIPVSLFAIAGISVVAATTNTDYMRERIGELSRDAAIRESNWLGGLRLRDDNLATTLFGMGLGTFPRLLRARSAMDMAVTNFVIGRENEYNYLSISANAPLYIDQRLRNPSKGPYEISLSIRSPDGKGSLTTMLCEKVLLYSRGCDGPSFRPSRIGEWERVRATISVTDFQELDLGLIGRPVALSVFDDEPGTGIETTNIHLRDRKGHDLLENSDFTRGMERWYFTDDQHTAWRIKNQYLMTLFEEGALGLAAFLLLLGTALVRATVAAWRGDAMGAILGASLTAFLCSCLSDAELEAPRLAMLFFLIAFVSLLISIRGLSAARISWGRGASHESA